MKVIRVKNNVEEVFNNKIEALKDMGVGRGSTILINKAIGTGCLYKGYTWKYQILSKNLKYCPSCNSNKDKILFSKVSRNKDGLNWECKKCKAISDLKYNRTQKGVITAIYLTQKSNSTSRGHNQPSYTKRELSEWLYKETNFIELYNNWVLANYDTFLKPSVDRKDEDYGYMISNIQLMTWGDNDDKETERQEMKVFQYDLKKNIIKEYCSQNEAARQTGYSKTAINKCCNNKYCKRKNVYKGFIWSSIEL